MLEVPTYRPPENNLFDFREREMDETSIISLVTEMLTAGEGFGLRVSSVSIADKEEKNLSEIKKTKSKMLTIDLTHTKENNEPEAITLEYEIPWLVNRTHFYIGGNYKVCVLQLYDKPIIKKKEIIKIKTNIQSIMVEVKTSTRRKYHFMISMFGKKFPLAKLIISSLGTSICRERFGISETNECVQELNEDMTLLAQDICKILNDASLDKDRLLEGEFIRRTDEQILEDLKLIYAIDVFSAKYFLTDSIVEEILSTIEHGTSDEMDYATKRLRFIEQVIFTILCKDFYNLINSIRRNRRNKFSINTKAILQNVNVSSIVQFDNSLNPLSELSMISRTSLSGPGGFEKANVPASLREIHPSMSTKVDPCDTADREGCGTTQYLVPTVTIEPGGVFQATNDIINSIAVSCTPFLEHDDPTRLQMASSQQRHSIMLKDFDIPLIQSGMEGMFTDYTSFLFRAKRDGKVIYLDNDVIVIQYDNTLCEAFHIGYRKLYISTVDFYNIYFNVNEEFQAGDVIAESNYLAQGRLTLGKNLKAAVMSWYGYNFEDGIVVSDKCVEEDYFTSVHYVDLVVELTPNKILQNLTDDYHDYQPLPKVFDRLQRGDVFAKVKTVDSEGFTDVIFEPVKEERVPDDCLIVDIKIYANSWNKAFPQFDSFIENTIQNQKGGREKLIQELSEYLTRDQLDQLLNILHINRSEKNNYKIKGDKIDGLRIEITALYERKLSVGDKLANRHGNKGIISAIVPHEKMPVIPETGEHAEILINHQGIVSRMNIGQLYELHLGQSFCDLKSHIRRKFSEGETQEAVFQYILDYIAIIDKTSDGNYHQQVVELLEKTDLDGFVQNLDTFFLIQPPFESIGWEELHRALDYTGTKFEYPMLDPVSGQMMDNEVAFGSQYFFKLNHIAEDKIAYRGVGPYSVKTSQPLGGKSRKGGQRLGEMEIWAVIAHGAEKNLDEFVSVKSDSIKRRNQYISEKMANSDLLLDTDDDPVPQSLRLFQTSLASAGLNYDLYDETMEVIGGGTQAPAEPQPIQTEEVVTEQAPAAAPSLGFDFGPSFGNPITISVETDEAKKELKALDVTQKDTKIDE